jgi:hypothetical protein
MNATVMRGMLNKLIVPAYAFLTALEDVRMGTALYLIFVLVIKVISKTKRTQRSACPNVQKGV